MIIANSALRASLAIYYLISFDHKGYYNKTNIYHLILLNFNSKLKSKSQNQGTYDSNSTDSVFRNTDQSSHINFHRNQLNIRASESTTGKSSFTRPTIQTRAAAAGVLLERNLLTLILIPIRARSQYEVNYALASVEISCFFFFVAHGIGRLSGK